MPKKRSPMDDVYAKYRQLPMPPEYKTMFFSYAKLFFKWMEHINHALDTELELENEVTTAAGIRKCTEMKDYISEVCYLRDTILVSLSMIVFIGMNAPSSKTLSKFKELYDLLDDNILRHMAIIQRYTTAIREKKRMSFKGLTMPITADDIQDMDCWPSDVLLDSCFINGTKILSINAYIKGKNE